MIVYVETNYVLELALRQEQAVSCAELLGLAQAGRVRLVAPVFSLVEAQDTLARRHAGRGQLADSVERELRELRRTEPYAARAEQVREAASLLVESAIEEGEKLDETLRHVGALADVIPLDWTVLSSAAGYAKRFDLSPPDSLVYASVIRHLKTQDGGAACFLNRNTRDFDDPEMIAELRALNCRLIPGFDGGLEFVRRSVSMS